MKTPELLAPAGTLKNMRYAFAYGADAVYAGQPRYSLRVRNNDFSLATLRSAVAEAHDLGKKFFLAANILPHNAKVSTFMADMEDVVAIGPDALIMADPGLIMLVRERWPDMPIHLSVQANTLNYAAVRFWQTMGLTRIILSRELSLDEVAEIRQRCPDMELEVFVHGALCIAYSGRCLLSGYFNHRDPNQGTCTNSCRWDYKVHDAVEDDSGGVRIAAPIKAHVAAPIQARTAEPHSVQAGTLKSFLLEEQQRPGQYMPIEEDEHGTYILNSKDLRAVEHVAQLAKIGVDCLKIEGRTKSFYYVARTAQVYRRAIDDAAAGKPFDTSLIAVLENLANRGYTDGFFQRHHTQDYQNYIRGVSESLKQQFVGEIDRYDHARGMAHVDVKNKIVVGDTLELIQPEGNVLFKVDGVESEDGAALGEAPGGGYKVWIPAPEPARGFGLLAKNL